MQSVISSDFSNNRQGIWPSGVPTSTTLVGRRVFSGAHIRCSESHRIKIRRILANVAAEDGSHSICERTLNIPQKDEKTAQQVKADSRTEGGRVSGTSS